MDKLLNLTNQPIMKFKKTLSNLLLKTPVMLDKLNFVALEGKIIAREQLFHQ
jgi:hypothetical protein